MAVVEIACADTRTRSERVRGWRRSEQRIAEITANLHRGGGVSLP